MLLFEICENNAETVTYRYYPEGHEDYGTLTVRKSDKEVLNYELAKGDDFKTYLCHLLNRVKKFIESGEFDTDGIVAWY